MGMWRRIKQVFAPGAAMSTASSGGVVAQLFQSAKSARRTDADAVMKKFRSWVYICASRNGSTCASVPLRLYAKGALTTQAKDWYKARPVPPARALHVLKQRQTEAEITELTEHPLLELLTLANPVETGFGLKELTIIHQELVGNAYWYLEPYGDAVRAGQPQAIWPLMPNLMKPVPNKAGNGIAGYLYGDNPATQIAYAAEEIIHFKYPNPSSNVIGLGPAQAGIMAINRSEAMAEYKQALYDNHCRPDFMVKVPDDTTDEQIKAQYEQWDKRFRVQGTGWQKVGRPWITTSEMSIETIGWAPKDMHDIPQAKLDQGEIMLMFGQHPSMGEATKALAEAIAIEYSYMKHAILPRLMRFEQTLNEYLAPLFDERLFFAFDNPVPEDREQTRKDIDTYVQRKVMTPNEARAAIKLDPIEGGDEFATAPAPVGGVPLALAGPVTQESVKAAMDYLRKRDDRRGGGLNWERTVSAVAREAGVPDPFARIGKGETPVAASGFRRHP